MTNPDHLAIAVRGACIKGCTYPECETQKWPCEINAKIVRNAFAALSAAGLVIVPREPTSAMVTKGMTEISPGIAFGYSVSDHAVGCSQAMLAATEGEEDA